MFITESNLNFTGGKMSFPDFLDVMHQHSQVEKVPAEILAAFKGHDPRKTGRIPARELRNILLNWGEKLLGKEGKRFQG